MNDAKSPELYPQYCFHLSPTINRWCHFRIADILPLTTHPGFEGTSHYVRFLTIHFAQSPNSYNLGQDVYFHFNHPVKWVRISGVVVAVDEWEVRRIYTIDDGSGATIQCVVYLVPRAVPGKTATTSNAKTSTPLPKVDGPIDVGHVLDIKGSLTTFRDMKNIRAEKITHLRSTEQEVAFWEKVALLKSEVLSKPWVLDRREVRRCRREEEGRQPSSRRHHRETSLRHKGQPQAEKVEVKKGRVHHGEKESRNKSEPKALVRRPANVTGLEKRRATKPITRLIPVRGNYDALGL